MNDKILEKVDDLVNYISNSDTYKDYLYLKSKLNNNTEIKDIIKTIKIKQKELVNKEYHKEDISNLEQELQDLENKLNNYPVYCDFIEKQNELNGIFSSIKQQLEECIDQNIT